VPCIRGKTTNAAGKVKDLEILLNHYGGNTRKRAETSLGCGEQDEPT